MTRPRPLVPRGDPADSVRVVGEFGVIARVLAQAGSARAARGRARVTTPPCCGTSDGRVVATTDVLVEGRHFRRDWSSAEDIGHKAAAANLADIAAMGGMATALLVGLACPAGHADRAGWRASPPAWPRSARRWAPPSSAATLVAARPRTAPPWSSP